MNRPPGGGLRWWCMRRSAELSLCFTAPLAWRSLICRLGRRQGRLGRLPFKCVSPLACPAKRGNCLQESRARGSATFGVFASLRSALLSAVLPFGQKPAHLVSVALFLTRQKPARLLVVRRSLHSVVPFQQIIAS